MENVKKKYLVTSALPYVNGIKHLGNLAGSLLPADIYSRFLRSRGEEVIYISATDDHGTPTEIAAHEVGLGVQEYSDMQHERQKAVYQKFGILFDHFGRTSKIQNIELTQHFAAAVHERGFTEIRVMRQIYSIYDQRFLPDRYVVGTCPKCSYENARGDQCENCTQLLDPEDLINPRSSISGSTNLEFRDTKHLFLKLGKMAGDIRQWVDQQEQWPPIVKSIANKWLNEGLHDRCITRDLEWGVPVNIEGLEGKVFYVWFDAPIGYIAATKEWSDQDPENRNWKDYWYDADNNVQYVQFMAKDNIPFHTISFPATLLASGEPWKKVDYLKGFNWLNYYGDKFSTSQKRGVFTDEALDILPADYWRYYLTARAPETSDSVFTWEDFQQVVNADLVNVLGNFVNRVIKFNDTHFDGVVPQMDAPTEMENKYLDLLDENVANYNRHLEGMNFRKAIESLRKIWTIGNQYFTEAAPWKTIKTDTLAARQTVGFSLNYIGVIAKLSKPIIPFTADTIMSALGIENHSDWYYDKNDFECLSADKRTASLGLLFRKIEDADITSWRSRFSGSNKSKSVTVPINPNEGPK